MEYKASGIVRGTSCPTLNSITDCAQCGKKVEILIILSFLISDYSIDSVHQKKRVLECMSFDFDKAGVTDTWKASIQLCIHKSTWIGKWNS